MMPFLMTEASQAICKWCGQRDFIRQTYMQEYLPDLNGYVMLEQMPVNNVLRVRGYAQTVLTITARAASFVQAWVSFTTTGQWYDNTLAYTGLVLNWHHADLGRSDQPARPFYTLPIRPSASSLPQSARSAAGLL